MSDSGIRAEPRLRSNSVIYHDLEKLIVSLYTKIVNFKQVKKSHKTKYSQKHVDVTSQPPERVLCEEKFAAQK